MSVTSGNPWIPTVLADGQEVPLTSLGFDISLDGVGILRLTGYAPTTFDARTAIEGAGIVELALSFPEGDVVYYTATRIEESA